MPSPRTLLSRLSPSEIEHADRSHLRLMSGLYACQGYLQGMTGTMPFFLAALRGDFASADAALLATAILPFTCKFLWAPVVDGVWRNRETRRQEWIIGTQLLELVLLAASWFLNPDQMTVHALTNFLLGMVFISATQDIALDAWLIEGVSSHASEGAMAYQTSGLMMGSAVAEFLVVLSEYAGITLKHVFLIAFLAHTFALLLLFCYSKTKAYKISAIRAVKAVEHISHNNPLVACVDIIKETWDLRKDSYQSALVWLLLSRGAGWAISTISYHTLLARGNITPSFIPLVSLCLLPFHMFSNHLSSSLMKTHIEPIRVWIYGGLVILLIALVGVAAQLLMDPSHSHFGLVVVFPLTVIGDIVGKITWVSLLTVISNASMRVGSDKTGTVLTVHQSLANFGSWWASTAALEGTAMMATYLGRSEPDVLPHIVGIILICFGFAWVSFIVPSARTLYVDSLRSRRAQQLRNKSRQKRH